MKKIINPWLHKEGYYCFGCAPNNEAGVKMEFYEDDDDVVSIWKPEAKYQGWINTLHGGIQAVLLDEICAWVILRKLQTTGVTSKMETRYMEVDRYDRPVRYITRPISSSKNGTSILEATICNCNG